MAEKLEKVRRIDFYMADWFDGTIGMTCCERGLYITALMAIYSSGGPISVADLRARCQREHGKTFNHLLERLLDLGKLVKTEDGQKLDNQRCEKELKAASIRFRKASENGTRGNEIKKKAAATRPLSPSPSPSPSEDKSSVAYATGADAPATPDPVADIWSLGKAMLGESAGSLIGKARREHGDIAVLEAILACQDERPIEQVKFFMGCLKQRSTKKTPNEKLYAGAMQAGDDYDRELRRRQGNGRADKPVTVSLLDGG